MSDSSPDPTFATLGLPEPIVRAVADAGYTAPTPIQAGTVPALLDGHDVIGQAQTGTGKTAAFALPILARLDPTPGMPQALVLTPTRELAGQVAEAFDTYGKYVPHARVATVYGGQPFSPQFRSLKRRPPVVVGTPGRVLDHLDRGSLQLDQLRWLVLDEADEMLRMGFFDDVMRVVDAAPADRSMVLFSATMPEPIARVARSHMREPVEVRIDRKDVTAKTVAQRWLPVRRQDRFDALLRVLEVEEPDGVLVFVRTKAAAAELAHNLGGAGLAAAPLSGDLSQPMREATVERLRNGTLDLIVATDVAARGLDVERITHVVNFDVPFDSEAYVHRIGRTGRAGRQGTAILFVQPRERRLLAGIERATRQKLEPMELPGPREVNAVRRARFLRRLTEAAEGGDAGFGDLVDAWCADTDSSPRDAAIALAKLLHDGQPLLAEEPVERPRAQRSAPDDDRGRDRGPDRDAPRGPKPRGSRERPPRAPRPGMQWFRVRVGSRHGVQVKHVVGAIANEAGLPSSRIGIVDVQKGFTWVELPEGMPPELFQHLQRVQVCGRKLAIESA